VIGSRIAAVLFGCVSLGAASAITAPAGADSFSPAEQAYLDKLKEYGFTVTPEEAAIAVKLGHDTCTGLENGASPAEAADALSSAAPWFTEKQSANLVTVAQMKLCPDTLGK
jgi:uncharacterized protein DUF732